MTTDTLWSDISEFQVPVSDSYPYGFLCLRSNDGFYEDHHFTQNIAWARAAIHSGKLWAFMVYYFYRPDVNGASVLMGRVGKPDPRLTVMIDVESASGAVSGNQSSAINGQFDQLAKWVGSARRVVGYGNVGDLNSLWPQKPSGMRLVVADYGGNPGYTGKFAHQFSDNANTPPFGPSDLNSADGMSETDLMHMYGFSTPTPPPPPSGPPYRHVIQAGNTSTWNGIASSRNMTEQALLAVSQGAPISPDHLTALEDQITAGDSCHAAGFQRPPLAVGTIYYTNNP